ncbi:heterokaryon incompatibility protein-domain-containing protein [Earliella scabrosa]|nr:heterokaryon incompatibility protein-domain-containing protein [Earliella scabrosa]
MYLLNTYTTELRSFANSKVVKYAIISHIWQTSPPEQTFQQVQAIPRLVKERKAAGESPDPFDLLSSKIRTCCRIARKGGYEWLWIDTCCIDNNSSAELSEAINSMFMWYADAQVCYAYLHDVGDDEDPATPGSAFRGSVWHTRGWTLQELLAPACVVFLSKTWRTLGSKYSLALALVDVTGISHDVLTRAQSNWLEKASVAERMSWAAKRNTTRVEDRAYSLMGIFGINMPTIYGEGPRAFIRLQEEILRRIPDQSILAWGRIHDNYSAAKRFWKGVGAEEGEGEGTEAEEGDGVGDGEGDDDAEELVAGTIPIGVVEKHFALDIPPRLEDLLASSPSDFAECAGIKVLSIPDFENKLGFRGKVPQYTFTSYGVLVPMYISRPVDSGKGLALVTGRSPAPRPVYAAVLACAHRNKHPIVLLLRPSHYTASPQYSVGEFIDGIDEEHYYRCALHPDLLYNRRDSERSKSAVAEWSLQEVYIRHDYSTLTRVGQPQLVTPSAEDDVHTVTFHIPQWRLNRLLKMHLLRVRTPTEDGLMLRVPHDGRSGGRIEHATASVRLVHVALKELLTVRIGVGCACTDSLATLPGSGSNRPAVIDHFWADVRMARVASPGQAQPVGDVLPYIQTGPGSEYGKTECGRPHFNSEKKGDGEEPILVLQFGDDERKVEVSVQYGEGLDPAGAPLRTSYILDIGFSGSAYERAREAFNSTASDGEIPEELADDHLVNAALGLVEGQSVPSASDTTQTSTNAGLHWLTRALSDRLQSLFAIATRPAQDVQTVAG